MRSDATIFSTTVPRCSAGEDISASSWALITTGARSDAQVWRSSMSGSSKRRGSTVWITMTPITTSCTISGAASSEAKRSSPVSGK